MPTTLRPGEKGLCLTAPTPLDELRTQLQHEPLPLTDDLFAWPLLTLDDDALTHNIRLMAELAAERAVWHAPHIKTPMSPQIWARQKAAGAWAATVATPGQLRTAYAWGVKRLLLANELVDPREIAWLLTALQQDDELDVWLQVDSVAGVDLLRPLADQPRLHVLVEVGVPSVHQDWPDHQGGPDHKDVPGPQGAPAHRGVLGRTGVRTTNEALRLAQVVVDAGLTLGGVTGYEGPAATTAAPDDLKAVADWCDQLAEVARTVKPLRPTAETSQTAQTSQTAETRPTEQTSQTEQPFIVSAGGSAFLDVVLDRLAPPNHQSTDGRPDWQLVVRSGAYVTSDDDHYAVLDPWLRLGKPPLRPAITVWAQVLSTPEPGLALLGAGRRDVPSDLGLPVPKWFRRAAGPASVTPTSVPPAAVTPTSAGPTAVPPASATPASAGPAFVSPTSVTPTSVSPTAVSPAAPDLGPRLPLEDAAIAALNDQHAFLVGPGASQLRPGDVVGLGISHPCTALDRWRVAALTREDNGETMATDLYTFDF